MPIANIATKHVLFLQHKVLALQYKKSNLLILNTKIILSLICLLLMSITTSANSKATPGIEYKTIYPDYTEHKTAVHILEIDPKLVTIKLVRAKDASNSRATVIDIAKHCHALAAINGGFFRVNELGEGLPAGILKINHRLYGIAYKTRAAIGWDNQANITLIDRIQTKTTLQCKQYTLRINGMNIPLSAKHAILYSDTYNRKQLTFEDNATHFIINDNKITNILTHNTITIPMDGYIYSVGSKSTNPLPNINIGEAVTINSKLIPILTPTTTKLWNNLPFVLNGAPLLLKHGAIIEDYSVEKLRHAFIKEPYARTAIGILSNGNWLLVVTEKNITTNSAGLTIPELAMVMQKLGCIDALNLDGGGSTTMYFNNKIINLPEGDEDEAFGLTTTRQVSEAVVIMAIDNSSIH